MDSEIVVLGSFIDIVVPLIDFSEWVGNTDYHVILYGISCVVMIVLTLEVSYLHKTVRSWGEGESPFSTKYVKGMRYLAIFSMLVMFFFQPLFLLFGVVLYVFTFLMEYGDVLEENANNTIKSHEQMILSLAEVIEVKSGQTGLHVKRVSEYSRVLAKGYGLGSEAVEEIRIASMLHDIGKLLIPVEILEKPGKLTNEEFDIIKKHTKYGSDLLEKTKGSVLEKAKLIANEHHEKWDGTGYNKKRGTEISIVARIVAVADVYDALVSKRSYKDSWSEKDAALEIYRSSGTHFDPSVVKVFKMQYDQILEIKNKYLDTN